MLTIPAAMLGEFQRYSHEPFIVSLHITARDVQQRTRLEDMLGCKKRCNSGILTGGRSMNLLSVQKISAEELAGRGKEIVGEKRCTGSKQEGRSGEMMVVRSRRARPPPDSYTPHAPAPADGLPRSCTIMNFCGLDAIHVACHTGIARSFTQTKSL